MTTTEDATRALACIDCGGAVHCPVWMLGALNGTELRNKGALCDGCRETRQERRREVAS